MNKAITGSSCVVNTIDSDRQKVSLVVMFCKLRNMLIFQIQILIRLEIHKNIFPF